MCKIANSSVFSCKLISRQKLMFGTVPLSIGHIIYKTVQSSCFALNNSKLNAGASQKRKSCSYTFKPPNYKEVNNIMAYKIVLCARVLFFNRAPSYFFHNKFSKISLTFIEQGQRTRPCLYAPLSMSLRNGASS